VIVVLFIGYFAYRNTEKGAYRIDKMRFSIPIQKDIIAALMGAKFSRNLSILLKSGFSFSIALEMLKPIMNNLYMSTLIDDAIDRLKEGESLSDVIENFNLFPGVMIRLFSVAQQTGHMDKMLDKVADEMEKEADMKLESIATVLEPLLIILLSILVGVILVSVILPIINILVEKYAIQCYATEGAYPPNVYYLEEHYGLILDEEKYIYSYEPVAENIKPVVQVFIKPGYQ